MALPKKDCKFCCGTGYRMSRVIPNDLRPEIVALMSGGGIIPREQYQDALDRADKVIDLVLARHEQESA